MDNNFLSLAHSLLRYAVLLTLVFAFFVNLRGVLQQRPILTGERTITILAMVLCHVQLVIGIILLAMYWNSFNNPDTAAFGRFIKFEHSVPMVLAIALITIGRVLSKRAQDERTKQMRIVVFYGLGLALILASIPWPFRNVGYPFGWL